MEAFKLPGHDAAGLPVITFYSDLELNTFNITFTI